MVGKAEAGNQRQVGGERNIATASGSQMKEQEITWPERNDHNYREIETFQITMSSENKTRGYLDGSTG